MGRGQGDVDRGGFEGAESPPHVERLAAIARALYVELNADAMVEIVTFGRLATGVAVPDVGPPHATATARDALAERIRSTKRELTQASAGADGAGAIGVPVLHGGRLVAVISAWSRSPLQVREVREILQLAAAGLAGWWGSREQRRSYDTASTVDAGKARERERRRLAYDLHGSVAQELAAARIVAETAQLLGETDDGQELPPELLADVHTHIVAAQVHTRRLISALGARAPEGSTLSEIAEALCVEYEHKLNVRGAVRVSLAVADLPVATSAELSEAFAFVLRETLQNVYEHAGATAVAVSASYGDGRLVLSVTDNGVGIGGLVPADEDKHLGLRGIRERLHAVGGSMTLDAGEPSGMRLVASFPVALHDGAF